MEVSSRVVFGGPRRFVSQLRWRHLGTTIQTAFMERWYGTLRGLVAPLRRRTRCLSWSHARHRGTIWRMVSLYNFVMPHKSLRQGHTPRTPAMAIGLTDHVWSYREYIHRAVAYTVRNESIEKIGRWTLALKTLWNTAIAKEIYDVCIKELDSCVLADNRHTLTSLWPSVAWRTYGQRYLPPSVRVGVARGHTGSTPG